MDRVVQVGGTVCSQAEFEPGGHWTSIEVHNHKRNGPYFYQDGKPKRRW